MYTTFIAWNLLKIASVYYLMWKEFNKVNVFVMIENYVAAQTMKGIY